MGIKFFLLVGLGGGLGSIFRALISQAFSNYSTVATVLANLGGAFLIGYLVKWGANHTGGELFRAFWIIGICGGFTTFSAFAYENQQFLKDGDLTSFAIYSLGSLTLGILAVFLGLFVSKSF